MRTPRTPFRTDQPRLRQVVPQLSATASVGPSQPHPATLIHQPRRLHSHNRPISLDLRWQTSHQTLLDLTSQNLRLPNRCSRLDRRGTRLKIPRGSSNQRPKLHRHLPSPILEAAAVSILPCRERLSLPPQRPPLRTKATTVAVRRLRHHPLRLLAARLPFHLTVHPQLARCSRASRLTHHRYGPERRRQHLHQQTVQSTAAGSCLRHRAT